MCCKRETVFRSLVRITVLGVACTGLALPVAASEEELVDARRLLLAGKYAEAAEHYGKLFDEAAHAGPGKNGPAERGPGGGPFATNGRGSRGICPGTGRRGKV